MTRYPFTSAALPYVELGVLHGGERAAQRLASRAELLVAQRRFPFPGGDAKRQVHPGLAPAVPLQVVAAQVDPFENPNFETGFSSRYRLKGWVTRRFQATWVNWIQLVQGPRQVRRQDAASS
jgi:hypothetical protein